jgi:hypothetical protein
MGEVFDGRIEMEEEKIQVTPEQEIIMEEFSTLVRKILTQSEASFADKVQRDSFKRIVENQVYEARNNILKRLATSRPPEVLAVEKPYGTIKYKTVEKPKVIEAISRQEIPNEEPNLLQKDITRKISPMRM